MVKEPNSPAAVARRLHGEIAASTGRVPDIRRIRREASRLITAWLPASVLSCAEALLRHGSASHRMVAYELIHHHPSAHQHLDEATLERLGRGIDEWGAVDMFAWYLSGPAWREGTIGDETIGRWARSNDRWWRRAALVSTVPLNSRARGGEGDAERTLRICAMLAGDRDDMVVKAMSWALRELARRDPRAVLRFIEVQGNRLAPRVRREVRNKLTTGLKNPKRR